MASERELSHLATKTELAEKPGKVWLVRLACCWWRMRQVSPAEVDRLLDQISDLRETIRDLRTRLDAETDERRVQGG